MAMAFEQFIELYDHPILKITVNNENTYSSVKEIVLRITYDDLKDDQDIKFTLKEKNSWLPCQRDLNDFYILIPNNLQQKTIIYGHIIPSNPDLIEPVEETQLIYNKYNFVELYNHLINNPGVNKRSSQWSDKYGEEYEIQSTIIDYDYDLDFDKKGNPRLTLQSKLNMSIDDVNNPNYKNYVETSDGSNQTEKGKFPLSSRFRSKQNFEAPDIEKENPKWKTEIISEENLPVFEVRINRRGLSTLITNGVVTNDSLEQFPINIELNYDYLSTSREYHQHYYGLEGENRNKETGALTTENKTINVLEGDKLHTLDSKFNTNNYRIINWGNPYDNRHSMYVNHDEEIPISLANGWKNQNDLWYRNVCYDYYRLVGGKDGITSKKIVNLEKDREYSLCFFMFIPSYTTKSDCSVSVITLDENNIHKLYNIDSIFLKEFTNEWIYHEIPFIADKTNTVEIVTPPEGESVFFTNMVIKKMPRYTPTLQYTDRGLQVLDTDSEGKLHNTFKSVNEEKDPEMLRFQPDENVEYISTNKILPTPFTDVIINTELDYDLIYDDISKNLYSIYPNTSENEDLHFLEMIKTYSDIGFFVSDISWNGKYENGHVNEEDLTDKYYDLIGEKIPTDGNDINMKKNRFSEIFGSKFIKNGYINDEYNLIVEYDIFNDISQISDVCTNLSVNQNFNIDIEKNLDDVVLLEYYNFPEPEDKSLKEYPSFDTYQEYEDYYEQYRVRNPDHENLNYNYIQVIDNTMTSKLRVVGENENMDLGFGKENTSTNKRILEINRDSYTVIDYNGDSIARNNNQGIQIENGKLTTFSFVIWNVVRGKAYLNDGWNNSDEWILEFDAKEEANFNAPNVLYLIRDLNNATYSNQLTRCIAIQTNGRIFTCDNDKNQTTIAQINDPQFILNNNGGKTLHYTITKNDNHYQIQILNKDTMNKHIINFTSKVLNNSEELHLWLTCISNDRGNYSLSNCSISSGCCFEENTLYGFYSDYIEASYGPGNYISLNFSDEQGNPINDGYVDISIMKNKQQDVEWTDEQYNFKRKYVKNGVVQWNNVDLTYLKPNDNDSTCPQCTFYNDKDKIFSQDSGIYYLKIEYTNECEYRTKKIYKRLRVGTSKLAIQAFVNEERKCNIPQITSKQIFAEDFPIKISAYVYDQNTGSVCEPVTGDIDNPNIGWCELSINDKKHQSTRMDLTGEFDFYLDTNDINCGEINTIKIEYFTKYNKVSCFTYFELDVDDCAWLRPAVPIVIKYFSQDGFVTLPEKDATKISYPEKEGRVKTYVGPNVDCCYDDYMLQYIETGPHKEYSVTVERYISYDGVNITVNGQQKNIDQYWAQSDYKNAPTENKIYGIDVLNEQKYEDVGDNWGRFVIPDIGIGLIDNENIEYNKEGKYIINNDDIKIYEKGDINSHLIANKENQTIYYYYRITTDNLQYEHKDINKDLYRPYQRVFCIIKHSADYTSVYEYGEEPCRCDERIKITMKESL